MNQDLEALQRRIDLLERRIARAEDTEAIERLTRMYGYYLDKALWSEIIDLFTEDCSVEISALGVYVGRDRAAQLPGGELPGLVPDPRDCRRVGGARIQPVPKQIERDRRTHAEVIVAPGPVLQRHP